MTEQLNKRTDTAKCEVRQRHKYNKDCEHVNGHEQVHEYLNQDIKKACMHACMYAYIHMHTHTDT